MFPYVQDVASGKTILFIPRLPANYAVWMGEIKPPSYFKVVFLCVEAFVIFKMEWQEIKNCIIFQETYMVSMAYYTDEIATVLHDEYKGEGRPSLFLLYGRNTDSNNFSQPANFEV